MEFSRITLTTELTEHHQALLCPISPLTISHFLDHYLILNDPYVGKKILKAGSQIILLFSI